MQKHFKHSLYFISVVMALIATVTFETLCSMSVKAAPSNFSFSYTTSTCSDTNVVTTLHEGDTVSGVASLAITGSDPNAIPFFDVSFAYNTTDGRVGVPVVQVGFPSPYTPQSYTFVAPADGQLGACVVTNSHTGNLTATGTITGTVTSSNQTLVVNAGPDQQGNTSDAVTLHGSVIDNRPNPSEPLTLTWTKLSGPGTVNFANPSSAQTTATFSQPGKYVLQLTASDSQLSVSSTVNVSIIDHYLVELKAWIPQASIVDPFLITSFNFPNSSIATLGDPLKSCFAQAANNRIKGNTHVFSSSFLGDGHASYGRFPSVNPDYRVLDSIQFDFDGTQILNFTTSPIFIPIGESTRNVVINAEGNQVTCSQSAPASPASTQSQIDATSFTLSVKASNPLVPSPAPAIDGGITGHLETSGDISFDYTTDYFPSYGIAVQRNAQVWMENVINDASCVPTQGYLGAAQLAVRLITIGSPQRNTGLATRSSGNVPCVKQYYPDLVSTAEAGIKVTVNKFTEPSLLENVSHL